VEKVEYIYASLLLHSSKKEINEENIRKVLEAAGIQVDEVRIKALVAALKEVNIDEVLKNASAVQVAPVAASPAQAVQQEVKKEEKKEEEEKKGPSEEEIAGGLANLFG
jgi:large subunit ribosomal protein L12